LVVAVAVGLALGRFVTAGRGEGPAPGPTPVAARTTEAEVAALQDRLRRVPDDAPALTRLGVAYLARARETADPGYYAKAAEAVERSLALDPGRAATLTAAGLVALGRHDFAAALEWGRRAAEAAPDSADPLGVVFDAQVELGRYEEAVGTAQAMVDRRPSLAALARVSYVRELHGDRAGAVAAMAQAMTAGAPRAGDQASVAVLLGDLHLGGGDLAAASRAYDRALAVLPGYPPAEAGIARVAAASGDIEGAVARLEPVVRRVPSPEWAALLGDLHAALGRPAEAAAAYDLVRRLEALNQAAGVAADLELARFEADQAREPGGRPDVAVALAEAAFAQRPTVYAADALGWALRQAGRPAEALGPARAAVRLGTADALIWYHLAAVEADLGLVAEARDHLGHALALNPFLTVRDRPAALDLAERLGLEVAR
jgi:tetratricopeptide (TPR) repeat protein